MPLLIDGRRTPPRWAEKTTPHRPVPIDSHDRQADCIRIAFVNNMPDAALEDTEMQFFELLDTTSREIPLRVKLYSLPGIPRGERGQQHLSSFYYELEDLWRHSFDAVIITGTEPCSANLRDEPYWPVLADLLDWAQRNTVSTILSCLAAHASVLYSDGIERHRLSDKRFGVFGFSKISGHPLTEGSDNVYFPHSRWNEVQADALTDAGYTILTHSPEAGVDSFVKMKKNSLFLHFQGHPEYFATTLLKEYRRDIKRFLRGERETYPTMPCGYFDESVNGLLSDFRAKALFTRRQELIEQFPESVLFPSLQNAWHSSAATIYRNWFQYVVMKKLERPAFVSMESLEPQPQSKISAAS